MRELTVREIGGDDAGLVAALAAEHLPTDDLTLSGRRFFAFADGGAPVGFAGYEDMGGGAALLRSLVILPAMRRRGYAAAAVLWRLRHLAAQGFAEVYFLTVNPVVVAMAGGTGFAVLPRAEAPPPVRATRQFSGLCPASAVLLHRKIAPGDGRGGAAEPFSRPAARQI